MIRAFFKHISQRHTFSKAFKKAVELSKTGSLENQETAFKQLNSLLKEQPENPYLRRQVLLLGEQLHKPVNLPVLEVRTTRSLGKW